MVLGGKVMSSIASCKQQQAAHFTRGGLSPATHAESGKDKPSNSAISCSDSWPVWHAASARAVATWCVPSEAQQGKVAGTASCSPPPGTLAYGA